MFQELLDNAYKSRAKVDDATLEYNLSRAMFYLALTQIHLSGAIGNLLETGHEEMAKTILKSTQAANKIYEPAITNLNYDTFIPSLEKMIAIMDKVVGHSHFTERLESAIDKEIEAIKKEFLEESASL